MAIKYRICIMGRSQDLTGKKFHKLTFLEFKGKNVRNASVWLCACECGEHRIVLSDKVKEGRIKSCGKCRKYRHSLSSGKVARDDLAQMWHGMMRRCYNQSYKDFRHYGGRGITVCDRWRFGEDGMSGMDCFLSDIGERPSAKHSIDRRDNNGSYEPGNVRWATQKDQMRNVRTTVMLTINGETRPRCEWAEISGISSNCIKERMQRGWPTDELLLPTGSKRTSKR